MALALDQPTAEQTQLANPDHVLTQLLRLQAKWKQDYLGDSNALSALRDILVEADWRLLQIRPVFHQLHEDLELTGLPMHHWDRFTQRHYLYYERLQTKTENHFTKALKSLHEFHNSLQPRPIPKSKQEPPDPPPLIPSKNSIEYRQLITVTVVAGKVITQVDRPSSGWLDGKTLDSANRYCRQFDFPDSVIPEPYAYVLIDGGVTNTPAQYFFLYYSPAEFIRICQLEVDTNSEYLLDGERIGYDRLYYPDISEEELRKGLVE